MLGGKLFDSKDLGPYTAKNLDKIRSGEGKFIIVDGKATFVDQTTQTDTKGDNKKVVNQDLGGSTGKLGKGAGRVFAYPLGRDIRDSEDTLLIKAIEYIPPKKGAGLGVDLVTGEGDNVTKVDLNKGDNPDSGEVSFNNSQIKVRNNSMTDRIRKGFANSDSGFKEAIKYYVHLPIPANVNDTNACQWGADTINFFELAGLAVGSAFVGAEGAAEAQSTAIKAITGQIKIPGLSDELRNSFTASVSGLALNALGSNVSPRSVLSRSTGQVLNSNTELLFEGVALRTFPFDMTFTPRSPEEMQVVREIIKSFKKSMAARQGTAGRANGKLFLKAPDIFLLRYLHQGKDHPFLNAFKPCALTQLTTNYTGAGIYSTYNDGTPVQIKLRMVFKEINPIYQEDYDEKEAGPGVGY